ncbi:phospholemman-like [Mugil cephalus]|uniref:phospholemman-like n=1 Tax=Mugil cephalus TaxID=48193 RepID=UPI001FB78BC9|nr:phospholemman-like [Mugil cephalus]
MATTESMFPDQSDFDYDYETLRTTGVILAVIMFVSGILIALTLTHLVPRFQRQRCLLQLYRKRGRDSEVAPGLKLANTQTHTCATHQLFCSYVSHG